LIPVIDKYERGKREKIGESVYFTHFIGLVLESNQAIALR
jgi:hypothetical protein